MSENEVEMKYLYDVTWHEDYACSFFRDASTYSDEEAREYIGTNIPALFYDIPFSRLIEAGEVKVAVNNNGNRNDDIDFGPMKLTDTHFARLYRKYNDVGICFSEIPVELHEEAVRKMTFFQGLLEVLECKQ